MAADDLNIGEIDETNSQNLSLAFRELTSVPLLFQHQRSITSLDLTGNELRLASFSAFLFFCLAPSPFPSSLFFRSLENLNQFPSLSTLVLDKGRITDLSGFPPLPSLRTLWFVNESCLLLVYSFHVRNLACSGSITIRYLIFPLCWTN